MDKHNATATYVTWRQLEEFSSFLGAELGKAESRANARIKTLEADVAALRADLEILRAHKAPADVSLKGVMPMRGRNVA